MVRRALIVGSQTFGLTGVDTDVEHIGAALAEYGFELRRCTGPEATREGILEAYQRLIADTAQDDAVVVYYSGHGGLAANPDYRPLEASGVVRPRAYQFIVPFDMALSSDEDFRGIADLELSSLLATLTRKTANATVILDCCHAARMSRDFEMMPRALPRPWHVGVAAHIKQLRGGGLAVDRLAPESNADAVRLVACGPSESAFEYTTPNGRRMGLLTETVCTALWDSRGLRISWSSLAERIRRRVVEQVPTQHPEVEGPVHRVLFGTETLHETGVLAVECVDGQPRLVGGRLLGLEVGDQYRIVAADTGQPIADARVTQVHGAHATIDLTYQPGQRVLPDGARAVPLRKALHRFPVRMAGGGAARADLASQVDNSVYLRAATDADGNTDVVLAHVEVTSDTIVLRDGADHALAHPKPADARGVAETLQDLTTCARAQLLRELRSGSDTHQLDVPFHLEWGRVQQGKPQPVARSGELLFPGESVYIRMVNPGQQPVYASIFDIGLSGRITLLTSSEPSGIELPPGTDYVVGADRLSGHLAGLPLNWPASLPRRDQHTETLVAIVADRPQDLRALEQHGMRSMVSPPSQLQQILEQIAYGGMRDLPADRPVDTDVRYAVDQITFLVDPSPAPPRELDQFLIDERPDLSLVYRSARSGESVTTALTVRFTDLILYRRSDLFDPSPEGDIRVDTLVTTAPVTDGAPLVYRAETARCVGVRDGDHLRYDNFLAFQGLVTNVLDIGVWLSRDRKDSRSLMQLLHTELDSTRVGTLPLPGGTMCHIASQVLARELGSSIGLYRTSLLAQDGFGIGRHPRSGPLRAQDFGFAFEIAPLQ
jgi:caspase domain-containing protein